MTNSEQPLKRLSGRDLAAVFSGLAEKDLKTLYTCSTIRELAAGEFLMRAGDADHAVYVVLQGELKILQEDDGPPEETAVLRVGDWVGEITRNRKNLRTASVVAAAPSRVMAISENTVDALEAEAQMFFLKKLNDLASDRISRLMAGLKEQKALNRRLIERIHADHSHGGVDYNDSEIIRKIISKIPRLPSFASNLLVKLVDKNISLREAADIIKQDPSSVAVVLKAVNSPYYGLRQKISDINHALMLIGFSRIYQLIVTDGLQRTMPNTSSFHALQSHSVAISYIAYGLSLASKSGHPSEMATVGLLHDLGRSIILLLKKQNPSLGILIDSLDHARLGALLLKEWRMPEMLTRSIAFQSCPEFLPPDMIPAEIRSPVALLYLAHLCLDILEGKSGRPLPDLFMENHLKLFGWEKMDLIEIVHKQLLPTLTKTMEAYPIPFRKLLEGYLSQGCMTATASLRSKTS